MIRLTTLSPMTTDPTKVHVDKDGCINPFHQDNFNMGRIFGKNVTILHMNFSKDECSGFIIVNTRTGEQVQVDLEAKCEICGKLAMDTIHSMKRGGNICRSCIEAGKE